MTANLVEEKKKRQLFQTETAFFGKITAGVSHDLNNVLTIINEYSGLLSDLSNLAQEKESVDLSRFVEITNNITQQINRGKEIIKRLNRFAHSADDPGVNFDLRDLISAIVGLSSHFSRSKKLDLEANLPSQPIDVCGDPFRLQQAVFLCLQIFLENYKESKPITLSCGEDSGSAKIVVSGPLIEENEDVRLQKNFLEKLLEGMGGSVEISVESDRGSCCTISIPRTTEAVK